MVPVYPRSPPPTANALYRYFAGRADDPRGALRRGYSAYQKSYNVSPATYEECAPLFERPMTEDPAGRSFARSRAEVVAQFESAMRSAGVAAMVYPTLPFNAPRAVDRGPQLRNALP